MTILGTSPHADDRWVAPLILWRVTNEFGRFATCECRLAAGCRCDLRITVGSVRLERFADAFSALRRATEMKASLLGLGWRECAAIEAPTA